MKITYTITMASALLLAAGCAHEERSYTTSETGYSSGHISEYNTQNNYSSGGGASSSQPTYSGSVGADGTYTPYASSDSSVSGGFAAGAGTESDNTIVAQVRESLRQDPEIALIVPNIQISAHNGVIILNGSVQSEEQKRQILSRIKNVSGVVTVNNQLNVMAGPNGQNSSGSQLNPTGASSDDSQRLYKDANTQDSSPNNALNSTSRQNGETQIYHQGEAGQNQSTNNVQSTDALNPTSQSSGQSQMLQNGQQQNNSGQSDANSLDATSRTNSSSQIYHDSNQGNTVQDQNQSNMNQSSNSVNGSSNSALSPTSRQNGSSQIYQNNPGENSQQNQNSNNVQGTTIQNQ